MLILITHGAVSYSFTRPRRRRERTWVLGLFYFFMISFYLIKHRNDQIEKPSVCVYRLFVAVCACGIAWGVALAIWDIMIASGQYYKEGVDIFYISCDHLQMRANKSRN